MQRPVEEPRGVRAQLANTFLNSLLKDRKPARGTVHTRLCHEVSPCSILTIVISVCCIVREQQPADLLKYWNAAKPHSPNS